MYRGKTSIEDPTYSLFAERFLTTQPIPPFSTRPSSTPLLHKQKYIHKKNIPERAKLTICLPLQHCIEAKFLVSDWGNIVNSGIGLSYRSARLHWLAGLCDNTLPQSTIFPSQGLRIWPLVVYIALVIFREKRRGAMWYCRVQIAIFR